MPFSANASVRTEVTDSAVYEFIYEIRNLVENGITEEELAKAKAELSGSFGRSLEQPADRFVRSGNGFQDSDQGFLGPETVCPLRVWLADVRIGVGPDLLFRTQQPGVAARLGRLRDRHDQRSAMVRPSAGHCAE